MQRKPLLKRLSNRLPRVELVLADKDPAAIARKKVTEDGDQSRPKAATSATGISLSQLPAVEVVDADSRMASFLAAASLPFASGASMTLHHQLGEAIRVCPPSSPRGSDWCKVAVRGSLNRDCICQSSMGVLILLIY
jgi:hypothetical protein